jgi:primosomal protein N'
VLFHYLTKKNKKTLINDKRVKLLGPASNIILKRKGMYGMHLLIQSSDRKLLNKTINDLKPFILNLQKSNQIKIQIDPHEI